MSRREFHLEEGSSRKFWAVSCDGTSVTTEYGRIGSKGRSTTKDWPSEEDATQSVDKLVAEKTRKGYVEVSSTIAVPTSTAEATVPTGDTEHASDLPSDFDHKEMDYSPMGERSMPDWLRKALDQKPTGKAQSSKLIDTVTLPPILVGESKLTDEQVARVLSDLSMSTLEAPTPLVAGLREHADSASLGAFSWKLFDTWLSAGAPSKEKWLFLSLGHFADDEAVLRLAPLMRKWPGESQHQRAVVGLSVLRAVGSDTALTQLNGMAQKLKYKGLQERARQTMNAIATDRGLTTEQLEDRIVPDLDLDPDGGRVFDYGTRQFYFVLAPDLEPRIRYETGRVAKDLPKPDKDDDQAKAEAARTEWKQLKKQYKEVARVQSFRFEQAMITGRRWSTSDFESLLLPHPILSQLVRRLLWSGYQKGKTSGVLFRVTEDNEYVDVAGKPCTLDGVDAVGVVHPLNLSQGQLSAWQESFAEHGVETPFPQLERPIHALTASEQEKTWFRKPLGPISPSRIRRTLEGSGWRRSLHDHGGIVGYTKAFHGSKVTAVVVISPSILLSFHENEDQTIERVFFLAGANSTIDADVSYFEAESFLPLDRIDPVAVSEVLRELLEM